MRALVCDWCGAVSVPHEGWLHVHETPAMLNGPLSGEPRTFCSLDCLGLLLDDLRTSPTGAVTGNTPPPVQVDVRAEQPPVVEPYPEPVEPSQLPGDAEFDVVRIVTEPTPLRGLGRGLGRTGS